MIIFISDLDLRGSGYMNIAIGLCNELSDRGRNLYVLGLGYKGDPHNWPFSINPVPSANAFQTLHAMLQNLQHLSNAGEFPDIEAIIVALDLPLQQRLLDFPHGDIPYIGIFPVESGPLCPTWASWIARMDERLVISKYGLQQMKDAGLYGTYLPIGIDRTAWRRPDPEERRSLRDALGFSDEDFVVLTVADNQERKNLSAAAEMIRRASDKMPIQWQLVTRQESPVGWRLTDPPFDLGGRMTIYERGLTFEKLWMLYAVSDAFLLTSKAEGLCMPIIEAMACGVPVVALNCTAVPEHLVGESKKEARGFPIAVEFVTIDPWGNSERSFPSIEHGVRQLREVYKLRNRGKIEPLIQRGINYAEARTWDNTGGILHKRVMAAIRERKAHEPVKIGLPPTVPQIIPSIGGNGEREKQE